MLLLATLVLMPTLGEAADEQNADKKKTAYLTAKEAGADFEIQGEYSGKVDAGDSVAKVGIQLIARGEGKFEAAIYIGGLPGEGWYGEGPSRVDCSLNKKGVVLIESDNSELVGLVKDGKISVVTDNGDGYEVGVLKKQNRKSPTLGAKPPEGANVLFDGSTAETFENGRISDEGLLMQGVTSKDKFKDAQIHIEFRTPFMPYAKGQDRGNSGAYLQGCFEVQMLDSFGVELEDNITGAIYGVRSPEVNACFPPLSWQTYDVDFTAPKFDEEGKKTASAKMTVKLNGIVVQRNIDVPGPTRAAPMKESADAGPLYLQDHGNPVRYRNIWILEK